MSQENQSCLRFSLEESLWFRRGQEVAELVSISLDPDITIQENDQYVTIRGSLELTGEYRSDEDSAEIEEENAPSQKYVERVDPQEEGICEFSHRFPVDITIPNNRIQSIYDIDVIVESFDYAFPERSCLKLSAELTISGLYDSSQQQKDDVVEEEEQYEVLHRYQVEVQEETEQEEELHEENQFEDTFLFEAEARKQPEEEKVEPFPKFPTFTYEEPEPIEEPQQPVVFEHARSEISEPVDEMEEIAEEAPKQPVAEEVEVEEPAQPKEPVMEESSSSPEEPPKQVKKKASKKKTMTLTEFFARKEEASDQARLKVCIVQKGDTLESLSDRYDVSVPNLLRYNNLELNQDVYEGQVLYVPVAFAKK